MTGAHMPAGTDQIVLIGDEPSVHACWDDAAQHIAAATGVDRAELWFRHGDGPGLLAFDGWSSARQEPGRPGRRGGSFFAPGRESPPGPAHPPNRRHHV